MKKVIITSPSLDPNKNVSGVSAVTGFIISNNTNYNYQHFELGKTDGEKRNLYWFFRALNAWFQWFWLMIRHWNIIIHFNLALTMRSILRDLPLILFAQLLRKKMIIHVHGGEYLEEQVPPKWAEFLLKLCFSGKKPKVVLGHTEKELLTKRYHANQVHVLPNCIDLSESKKYDGAKQFQLPINLLYIGRIDKNKGLEYILQALIQLKKNKENSFTFRMAGTGPDKDVFIPQFTNKLGSAFEYKGVVSGKEKSDLFRNSHVFLLPSMYEGLPISLLENMSYGNVPIVTNVGSIGSVVTNEKNGIIVKKQSANEILMTLERFIDDFNLVKELGANARLQIFSQFDPDKYIEKLNAVYDLLFLPKVAEDHAPQPDTIFSGIHDSMIHILNSAGKLITYFKRHKIFLLIFFI